jgi:hypothetical protein
MPDKATKKCLERRLARAYVLLLLVPPAADGCRRVSLGRHGDYEVRLVEFTRDNPIGVADSLWMELYAHQRRVVLDSCRCDEIKDAAIAAEELIAQSKKLNEVSS